jgi:chemotaxis protein methyltransferase CheR
VNDAALERGRRAEYGPWSLRASVPAAYRPFLQEGENGRRSIAPALRRMVHFAHLNLAGAGYPSAQTGTVGIDLLLCRNVLIYFERARARAVLERLGRCLAQDGWLVTGAAELPAEGVEGLRTESRGDFFALRPARQPEPAKAMQPLPPVRTARPIEPEPAESPPVQDATVSALEVARQLADSGDLAGAERQCRAAIARDKLDPAATWLLASILTEAGDAAEAAAALRRTLYLDPGHLLARFALGSLALAEGQEPEGRRHLGRVLAQLDGVPADEVLTDSGGLTARELRSAIQQLESRA